MGNSSLFSFLGGILNISNYSVSGSVTSQDTGIGINYGNGAGSILVVASTNLGAGIATKHEVGLIKLHYDGNNTPTYLHISGDEIITTDKSDKNTLLIKKINYPSSQYKIALLATP